MSYSCTVVEALVIQYIFPLSIHNLMNRNLFCVVFPTLDPLVDIKITTSKLKRWASPELASFLTILFSLHLRTSHCFLRFQYCSRQASSSCRLRLIQPSDKYASQNVWFVLRSHYPSRSKTSVHLPHFFALPDLNRSRKRLFSQGNAS